MRRLRLHRLAVLVALEAGDDLSATSLGGMDVLGEEEVVAGGQRIRMRSHQPLEDVALYYMLFATAARPQIARLEVRDYLDAEGRVRRTSEMRKAVAINGRARPLLFRSTRLDAAMNEYLAQRGSRERGLRQRRRLPEA